MYIHLYLYMCIFLLQIQSRKNVFSFNVDLLTNYSHLSLMPKSSWFAKVKIDENVLHEITF